MTELQLATFALLVRTALAAFAAAAVVSLPLYQLLQRISLQRVSEFAPESHQAKQGTPTMGGILVVIGSLVGLGFAYFKLDTVAVGTGFFSQLPTAQAKLIVVALLLITFAIIGFADDYLVPKLMPGKRGLGWKQKLVFQICAAAIALSIPYGGVVDWTWLIAGIFIVLFFANAYNFSDGLDGLAGGLALIFCLGLSLLSLFQPQESVTWIVCCSLCVSLIPFLLFNAPPAKMFMGDVGSLPIGAVLGFLVFNFGAEIRQDVAGDSFLDVSSWQIQSGNTALIFPLVVLSLVLFVELVPVPLQIFWVKVFKKKLFRFTPIHHGFEKQGIAESKVVWCFLLVQAVLLLLAVGIAVRFIPSIAGGTS